MPIMKICTKCKTNKPVSEFDRSRSHKGGLYPSCKQCVKSYRAANKDKIKQQNANYQKLNVEKVKAYRNSPITREKRRQPDQLIKKAEYNKKYHASRATLPEVRANEIMKRAKRRARIATIPDSMPKNWWHLLLAFYGTECMNPDCPYELDDWNTLSHDHVIPITMKGSTHSLENSQILCRKCNGSKNNKVIDYRNERICTSLSGDTSSYS